MAINIDKIKSLRLLKTPFFTPFNKKDKRHNSLIFFISPNLESTINTIKSPFMENLNMFTSFYYDWQISYKIKDHNIVNESAEVLESSSWLPPVLPDRPMISNEYFYDGSMLFFFNEASTQNVINSRLKKILYDERLRTKSETKPIYEKIKEEIPEIRFTYSDITKYNNLNLFVDNSLYFSRFMQMNTYKRDLGVELLYNLIYRSINSKLYSSYTKKTVIIPVMDWLRDIPSANIFDFNHLTPISMITRMLKTPKDKMTKLFDIDFVFLGSNGWFKVQLNELDRTTLNKFKYNIMAMYNNDPILDTQSEDKEDLKVKVIGKIEDISKVAINNLDIKKTQAYGVTGTEVDAKTTDKISKAIDDTVEKATDVDSAMKSIDNDDELKEMILRARDEEDGNYKISATRKARMDSLNDKFLKEKIKNSTVKELLAVNDTPLESTDLSKHVESIDDNWSDLRKPNFEKDYNIDADIVKVFNSLSQDKDIPMSVIDISYEDRSTSEDYILTYTVHLEDSLGKRHTIKFDMPKVIDNRFLRLRGNDKVIPGQMMNLPIIKTDDDTVQVVTNYNKIFITRYGQAGKLNANVDTLTKSYMKFRENASNANKVDPKDFSGTDQMNYQCVSKVEIGNNSKICTKYELPMEYVDMARLFNRITYKNGDVIYFNQDEVRHILEKKNIKIDESKVCIGIDYKGQPIYLNGINLSEYLMLRTANIKDLIKKYDKAGRRLTYSQASILSGKMPLIVVMAYTAGLTRAMDTAGIRYTISEKRPTNTKTYVKFEDGFISFDQTDPKFDEWSLLINGLMILPTEDRSVTEIDSKAFWIDMLEEFGTRNRSDGLDAFANLLMDPITVEVCKAYNLPYKYIEVLAYASSLLTDNKYNRHTDITGNRFRTNERLVHFLYKSLSTSYGNYLRETKNNRKDAKMTMTVSYTHLTLPTKA